MKLDLGAIAKGWIADAIKQVWQAEGVPSGVIDLGGNVLTLGTAPHADRRQGRRSGTLRATRTTARRPSLPPARW